MKVLGLIPARGLSDRVPFKNLADLCGRPLIEWTISAAVESGIFGSVIVSSEDSRVLRVAHLAGASTLRRPDHLATASSPSWDTVMHAFEVLPPFDVLMLLQPTSPLRTADDIVNAIDILDCGADSVISMTRSDNLKGARVFEIGHGGRARPKSVLHENGAIYAITTKAFGEGFDFESGLMYPYEMPPERSIDIDTLADLDRARSIIMRREAA